jgi:hypothetical protein
VTLETRRAVLGEMFAAAVALGGPARAADLAPSQASSGAAGETWLRLVADLSGRPVFSVLRGDVWGFLPQADDLTPATFARKLYGYWSLVERTARPAPDGSTALTTKGWSFYLDPTTGEVATRILNPYTGAMVTAKPLSGPPSTLVLQPGHAEPAGMDLTIRRDGDTAIVDIARISRFTTPDITWFKLEADFNTHLCKTADLDDRRRTHVPSTFSHNLVAEWQTWMDMHGAPGHILFRGAGSQVTSLGDAPATLRAAIQKHFPASR